MQTTVTDHVARNAAGQVQADTRSYRFRPQQAGTSSSAPSVFATTLSAPCSICGGTGALTINGPYNQPIKAVAHDGTVTFTAYDTKGRATEVATFPASQSGAWPRPALSLATSVVSTQWHATWNLPVKVARSNGITAFTYNAKGMMTGQATTPTTDSTGLLKFAAVRDAAQSIKSEGYALSAQNLVVTIVDKLDITIIGKWANSYTVKGEIMIMKKTSVTPNLIAKFTSYNIDGRLQQGIDQYGLQMTGSYDLRGNVVETRRGNSVMTRSYMLNGLLQSVRTSAGDYIFNVFDSNKKLLSTNINNEVLLNINSEQEFNLSVLRVKSSNVKAQTPIYTYTITCDHCQEKEPYVRDSANSACDRVPSLIKDPELAKCIGQRCMTGKIKCQTFPFLCNQANGWYSPNREGLINICPRNKNPNLGDTIIHEWAHSCGWQHNGGMGVPNQDPGGRMP